MGIGVGLSMEWSRVVGTVAPMGEYDLQIIQSEVVTEEGGDDFSSCHSGYVVINQGFHPLEVSNPFFTRDNPRLQSFFESG